MSMLSSTEKNKKLFEQKMIYKDLNKGNVFERKTILHIIKKIFFVKFKFVFASIPFLNNNFRLNRGVFTNLLSN